MFRNRIRGQKATAKVPVKRGSSLKKRFQKQQSKKIVRANSAPVNEDSRDEDYDSDDCYICYSGGGKSRIFRLKLCDETQ